MAHYWNKLSPRIRARLLPPFVIALTVAIVGAVIFWAKERLQDNFAEQLTQLTHRDAELLHALTLRSLTLSQAAYGLSPEEFVDDPGAQLAAIMEATTLPEWSGLLATRLFDPQGGQIIAMPEYVADAELSSSDLHSLGDLRAISHYNPEGDLTELYWYLPEGDQAHAATPLLEVIVPLHAPPSQELLGIAQFILDGTAIAQSLGDMKDQVNGQAALLFLASASAIVLALGLAFHRLLKINQLLAERTDRLTEANQELVRAAKSSAVGAVSAHLIHGLKNPLWGLQHYVSSQSTGSESGDTEWRLAMNSARRMQTLINDIVRVLKEQDGLADYEYSLHEAISQVTAKMQIPAQEKGVRLETDIAAEGALNNRSANLVILILDNIVYNAIQATPPRSEVSIRVLPEEEDILIEVTDQGPGVPKALQARLFTPGASSKEGGTGIGLAISKQLATYLGAGLELTESSDRGSRFTLRLTAQILQGLQDVT